MIGENRHVKSKQAKMSANIFLLTENLNEINLNILRGGDTGGECIHYESDIS